MEYIKRLTSPVGELTLASDGESLTGLWIAGQKYHSAGLAPDAAEAQLPVFAAAAEWLGRYFAGESPEPGELPLAPRGSGFRLSVWRRLLEIPCGAVTSYGEIARALGAPGAGRRRRGGAQPHLDNHTLPPRRRLGRRPHRLRRGPRRQAAAAGTRGRET